MQLLLNTAKRFQSILTVNYFNSEKFNYVLEKAQQVSLNAAPTEHMTPPLTVLGLVVTSNFSL